MSTDYTTLAEHLDAGEMPDLDPLQTAVFAAEFIRAREMYRHHVADPHDVARRALYAACEAVEWLGDAIAKSGEEAGDR